MNELPQDNPLKKEIMENHKKLHTYLNELTEFFECGNLILQCNQFLNMEEFNLLITNTIKGGSFHILYYIIFKFMLNPQNELKTFVEKIHSLFDDNNIQYKKHCFYQACKRGNNKMINLLLNMKLGNFCGLFGAVAGKQLNVFKEILHDYLQFYKNVFIKIDNDEFFLYLKKIQMFAMEIGNDYYYQEIKPIISKTFEK